MWRVRDRATFQALARAPRHRVGPVSLRFSNSGATNPPRVAYAVGRRVGSAVDRNRVRRRLRAAVSVCGDELVEGGAYLFEAERSVLTLGFTELCSFVGASIRGARDGRA
ncbi:MAG: ribonuclease P protein component [Acidimicrobiia bacterium]